MRDIIRADSCTDAWLQATQHLREQEEWRDYNLVLNISNPMRLRPQETEVYSKVDHFLVSHKKHPLNTVINTIFPASLYTKYRGPKIFEVYHTEIIPQLAKHPDFKWGTYFLRMTKRINHDGREICPLEYLIEKLRRQATVRGAKRAVYELNLVEPFVDIPIYDAGSDKHYHMGGPCLSHLSFKLKSDKSLILTALYRHHYYLERALGNFYGLAFLQDFVAREAGVKTAELVCHSTMAILDHDEIGKTEVTNLLDACRRIAEPDESAMEIRA